MHAKPVFWLALTLVTGLLLLLSQVLDRPPESAPAVAIAEGHAAALGLTDATSSTASVEVAKRHPSERPLQAFSGTGLDGKRLSISDFIGKRLTIFFFNPEVDEADFTAAAVARVSQFRTKNNFRLVGVALGSSRLKVQEFAKSKGLDFPIFDDSSGKITRKLGLRDPVGIYGFDDEGYLEFGMGYFAKQVPDPAGVVEDQLRKHLRLPERGDDAIGVLDTRPQAPMFSTSQLDRSEPFDFASLAGKPTVLIFFLHTCPHCHAALDFFRAQLANLPDDKRPEIVAISMANRPSAVRAMLKERKLEATRVLFDPEGEISEMYGVFAGFPDVFLIDASGKIIHRTQGWREDRDPALNRIVLSMIAGTRVPMLLNRRGYTGNDVCAACHPAEAQADRYTRHASAYNTIVTHNETRNPECIRCHVVGFDKPGGYNFEEKPKHLENVGCESCHGRGGPHLSPDFVPTTNDEQNFESICKTCHNSKHSISFDYEAFLPKISHEHIASLSNAERAALLGDAAKPRDVLPKNADYVGSKACESCHASEYKTWAASPHGHAVSSLETKGKANDAACLKCHTTGMGRAGGFPKNGRGDDRSLEDLASVGCEACHGPGGNHTGENAERFGTIVSLADKCDSCAILQICGSCHDEANDPGFEFNVDEKIEQQRHGTTEAGTGKPLPAKPTAQRGENNRTVQSDRGHSTLPLARNPSRNPA